MPGQGPLTTFRFVLAALLFSTSGVFRGFEAIRTKAIFAETELQTAVRAGVLCMVIREEPYMSDLDEEQIQLGPQHPGTSYYLSGPSVTVNIM
jgi:hypothetical protein